MLLCAAFGAAVLLAASPGRASSTPVSRLQAEMNALVQMPSGPPGAIAIVQRGRRRIVFSAGVAELGTSTPVTVVEHMRIASTSKAFSGAVALALVAEHRLSLDDTIVRLLPSLPKAWGRVTLRELLDHTSGLEDFSEDPAFLDYLVKNLHAAPSPTFILHFIAGTKPRFTPGTEYRYSNTDNFVIALMARRPPTVPIRNCSPATFCVRSDWAGLACRARSRCRRPTSTATTSTRRLPTTSPSWSAPPAPGPRAGSSPPRPT